MPSTFHRTRFTWLAYLMLAFFAYFLNILGPITPFLKDELGLDYTISSLHYTAFAVGILLVGLGGHLVIRRVGRGRALWIGAAGLSFGALLLVAGRSPFITIGAAFLMGLVGSLILTIIPSVLADQHGEQRAVAISEANVVSSLVSTAAPLLVGWLAGAAGSWRLALGIAAGLPLLLRLIFGRTAPPLSAPLPTGSARGAHPLPWRYWIYWAALVLSVSLEFCMISWSAGYLEGALGLAKASAAQSVSLFLAAMILGRLAMSHLVQRIPAQRLVLLSILLAGAGFLPFWTTSNVWVALAGLFVTGLGIAGLYPLVLSLAIGAAGSDTVQASARATLASGTAILSLPLVLGRLADLAGIRPAYGVVLFLLVAVFLVILFNSRRPPLTQPVVE